MYENLALSEIECPVCMDICILPVTLPCGHIYCEYCLRTTVQHQAFSCPKCRKRIGNFLRKNKNIVNLQLWAAIQDQYPEEVHKKQNGEDSGVSEFLNGETVPKLTYKPGEIREEFERSLHQESEMERLRQEKEEEASARLIKELQEEEARLEEERKKQLLIDEELARSFVEGPMVTRDTEEKLESNSGETKKPSLSAKIAFSTPKASTPTRTLETYFQNTPTISRGSSDDDSIGQEIHHFKPISTAPTTPPKRLPDGSSANNHILMVQANKTPLPSVLECNEDVATTSELGLAVEEPDTAGPSNFLGQEEILVKAKESVDQMEMDRIFALQLQKQWELEEKNARKRKGSNAYNLRQDSKKVKKNLETCKHNILSKVKRGNESMNRQSTLCRVGCHCCK